MEIMKLLNFVSLTWLGYKIVMAPVEGTPDIWIVAFAFGFFVAVYNVVNEK